MLRIFEGCNGKYRSVTFNASVLEDSGKAKQIKTHRSRERATNYSSTEVFRSLFPSDPRPSRWLFRPRNGKSFSNITLTPIGDP